MYGIEKNVFGVTKILHQRFDTLQEANRYLSMLDNTNKNKYIVYNIIELWKIIIWPLLFSFFTSTFTTFLFYNSVFIRVEGK